MTAILPALVFLSWATVEDLLYRRISNGVMLIALAVGFWVSADWIISLVCGLGGFIVTAACYRNGLMGGGDVKLAALMGIFLGVWGLILFSWALTICGAMAIISRTPQPLAPYVLMAYMVFLGVTL